jgi:hypothetical protein
MAFSGNWEKWLSAYLTDIDLFLKPMRSGETVS